jgi:hypothetical protein
MGKSERDTQSNLIFLFILLAEGHISAIKLYFYEQFINSNFI